jgi:hypothetical protein
MSNGFRVNVDGALDSMAFATARNDERQMHTYYVVACWNEDGSSHGGWVVPDAATAIVGAQEVNDRVDPDHTCRYMPLAIGISLEVQRAYLLETFKARGQEPPEWLT